MNNKPSPDWRRWLGRQIGVALLLKLALLTALWALFFSSAHRVATDDAAISHRFGIGVDYRD